MRSLPPGQAAFSTGLHAGVEEGSCTVQEQKPGPAFFIADSLMIQKCDLHKQDTAALAAGVCLQRDPPWGWITVGVMEEWGLPHTMGRLACKIRVT